MSAVRGIVHSERSRDRAIESVHAIQTWVGLPNKQGLEEKQRLIL